MFNFLLQGKVGEMMAPVQSPEAQLLIAIQNRQQDKVRDAAVLYLVSILRLLVVAFSERFVPGACRCG